MGSKQNNPIPTTANGNKRLSKVRKKRSNFNVKYIRNSKDYVVTKVNEKNESKFIDVTMKAIHHLLVDHIPA